MVLDLVAHLPKGIGVVTDNGFTSLQLAKELHSKSMTLCGTIRSHRVEVPKMLQKSKERIVESTLSCYYKPLDKNDKFRAVIISYVPKKTKP